MDETETLGDSSGSEKVLSSILQPIRFPNSCHYPSFPLDIAILLARPWKHKPMEGEIGI